MVKTTADKAVTKPPHEGGVIPVRPGGFRRLLEPPLAVKHQDLCLGGKPAFVFLSLVVLLVCYRGFNPRQTDFRSFYVAAQIVRHGAGQDLYDVKRQHEFQLRYAGHIGLIFNYPAATALLYLPGAWLPLRAGYVLWTALSLGMLLLASVLLNSVVMLFKHSAMMFAAALLYVPVWLNLMHGTTAICILLVYVIALRCLMRDREFAAGCALGAGLIKFHLVLPVVFVLLLRRRWRAVAGFATASSAFLVLCIAVSGWRFVVEYPRFLLRLPSLPFAAMNVSGMATLRGLYVGFIRREPPFVLMAIFAVTLLVWAARSWGNTQARGFAITTVITALISYHFNPHDLTLLIVPIAMVLKTADRRLCAVVVAAFAPPLSLFLLGPRFWLMGCSVLVLLIALMAPSTRETQFAYSQGHPR